MQAVIFAAGEGKRMRPLTLKKPKPMLEVLGAPLISYTLQSLPKEVTEIFMVVGYLAEQIKAYVGDSYEGRRITYVSQKEMSGTAEALSLVRPYLRGRFFTLCADDIYSRKSLEKLLPYERAMLLAPVDDPSRFSSVELDANGRVFSIEEKPKHSRSNLASTAVYLLDKRIFNYDAPLNPNGERYLPDMVSALAQEHSVYGVADDFWIPVGFPEDLGHAAALLSGRKGDSLL